MFMNKKNSLFATMIANATLLASAGLPNVAHASTRLHAPNAIHFALTIRVAMNHIHDSKVPLMAPTEPTYAPHANSQWPYMGAEVSSSATSYSVDLQWANKELPTDSPKLSQPPNTGLGQVVGSFGGTLFSSHSIALNQLYRNKTSMGDIAPSYIAPPKNVKEKPVYLGHGIEGEALQVQDDPILEWHEGDWTLQVTDMPTHDEIPTAKRIVTYLNSHLLPETHGVFGVNLAGDGEHTSAEWVYGNEVYSCSDYHYALQAAEMAVSMRVYPSGKLVP